MTNPLPETTRVKGGGSARIGMVVVAIALVAVVGIGIFGRQTPAPIAVLPPAISTAPSETASVRPTASPRPAATPAPAPTPVAAETYGASLTIGNVRYVTIMSELSPGHLSAELHFPVPPQVPVGTLEFSELWKNGHVDAAVLIDSWNIDLEELENATRAPANLLEATEPAQPNLADVPPPVTNGYEISVFGTKELLVSRLVVEVALDTPGLPLGATTLGVTAEVGGESIAVILEPGENDSFMGTFTVPRPDRAATVHLVLHDVQVRDSRQVWEPIGDFPFRLTPKHGRFGISRLIIDETGPGFRLVARTSSETDGESIVVAVVAHGSFDGPQVDRTQGRYNYCRWDVGVMAAPPRPGTDEADC